MPKLPTIVRAPKKKGNQRRPSTTESPYGVPFHPGEPSSSQGRPPRTSTTESPFGEPVHPSQTSPGRFDPAPDPSHNPSQLPSIHGPSPLRTPSLPRSSSSYRPPSGLPPAPNQFPPTYNDPGYGHPSYANFPPRTPPEASTGLPFRHPRETPPPDPRGLTRYGEGDRQYRPSGGQNLYSDFIRGGNLGGYSPDFSTGPPSYRSSDSRRSYGSDGRMWVRATNEGLPSSRPSTSSQPGYLQGPRPSSNNVSQVQPYYETARPSWAHSDDEDLYNVSSSESEASSREAITEESGEDTESDDNTVMGEHEENHGYDVDTSVASDCEGEEEGDQSETSTIMGNDDLHAVEEQYHSDDDPGVTDHHKQGFDEVEEDDSNTNIHDEVEGEDYIDPEQQHFDDHCEHSQPDDEDLEDYDTVSDHDEYWSENHAQGIEAY